MTLAATPILPIEYYAFIRQTTANNPVAIAPFKNHHGNSSSDLLHIHNETGVIVCGVPDGFCLFPTNRYHQQWSGSSNQPFIEVIQKEGIIKQFNERVQLLSFCQQSSVPSGVIYLLCCTIYSINVYQITIDSSTRVTFVPHPLFYKHISILDIAWVDSYTIAVITIEGKLLLYNIHTSEEFYLGDEFCAVSVTPCGRYLAASEIGGYMKFFKKVHDEFVEFCIRRFARRSTYLHWISNDELLCVIPSKRDEEEDDEEDLVLKPYIINLKFAKEHRKVRVEDILQIPFTVEYNENDPCQFYTQYDAHTETLLIGNSLQAKVRVLERDSRGWSLLEIEDYALELPLADEKSSAPLGMIVDYTCPKTTQTIFNAAPDCPLVTMLDGDGVLHSFALAKKSYARNPKIHATSLQSIIENGIESDTVYTSTDSSADESSHHDDTVNFSDYQFPSKESPKTKPKLTVSTKAKAPSLSSSPKTPLSSPPDVKRTSPSVNSSSPIVVQKRRASVIYSRKDKVKDEEEAFLQRIRLGRKSVSHVDKSVAALKHKERRKSDRKRKSVVEEKPVVPVPVAKSVTKSEIEIPKQFICPLTSHIMVDPVYADDGYTYEREAIEQWFKTNANSPVETSVHLAHKYVISNKILRAQIIEFIESQDESVKSSLYLQDALKSQIKEAVLQGNVDIMKMLMDRDARLLNIVLQMVFANEIADVKVLEIVLKLLSSSYLEHLIPCSQMKCGELIRAEGTIAQYLKRGQSQQAQLIVQYLALTKDTMKNIVLNAVKQHDFQLLELMLSRHWKVDDIVDNSGRTLLHHIACSNEVAIAEMLVKNGATINCRDLELNTPLHLAAEAGQKEMFMWLAEQRGCVFNLLNKQSKLAFELASGEELRSFFFEIIQYQPAKKYLSQVKEEIWSAIAELKRENTALKSFIMQNLSKSVDARGDLGTYSCPICDQCSLSHSTDCCFSPHSSCMDDEEEHENVDEQSDHIDIEVEN